MGWFRSALEAIERGPRVGQVHQQRASYGGLTDLGRFPFFGGVTVGGNPGPNPYLLKAAQDAYEDCGPVGAVMSIRLHVFSEMSFRWQRIGVDGRPGGFFGTPELSLLENPWPGGTTPDLLNVMELDSSLTGNCYLVRERQAFVNGDRLTRLDPANVTIAWEAITRSSADGTVQVPYGQTLIGYFYTERPGTKPILFLPEEVAHYKPLPDEELPHLLGKSWLSSVLADCSADVSMTSYKTTFLDNGAVPGMIVSFKDPISEDQAGEFVKRMEASHKGPLNAGKVLYLGAGADARTVGMNFEQLSLRATQGATESRIAAAGGVPATIVGFSEGLQGSTLNAGNYGSARRRFGDATLRPLWRKSCAALSNIVTPPSANGTRSRLWYDDRDVAFLQEDVQDEANIRMSRAQTIRTLIDAGYKPDAANAFADIGDASALSGQHTGLFSVQLQPPGTSAPAQDAVPSAA